MFEDVQEDWKKEWKNMPEFIQESKESIKGVTVHFETKKDLKKFNEVTGLNVTMKTKGVFFPPIKTIKAEYFDVEE